jgi:hypothetical protein
MRLQRLFLIKSVIFMLALLIFLPGFQAKKIETISGDIGNINKDSNFITVNETKIVISPHTKIVDEKDNNLKIEDLNRTHSVEIEGVHNPGGFAATKILVKTPKKKP